METKQAFKLIGALTGMLLLAACAHGTAARPSNTSAQTPSNGALGSDVYGPSPDMKTDLNAQNYGPAPAVTKSVVLVLGPGQARAFAEEGVIRALNEAKIQISAIYGVETGSLVGALYALDGSVNHLEWELMHFKNGQFGVQDSAISKFFNRRPDSSDLEEALKKAFKNRDLKQTKIPMKILVQPDGLAPRLYESGPIDKIVRAALGSSSEDDFGLIKMDGVITGSAAGTRPFPVEDAKKLAESTGAIVIAVDVLDPKTSDLFPELKKADVVISPAVQAIGAKEYDKRNDAVFSGKSATLDKIDEIKRLVNPS